MAGDHSNDLPLMANTGDILLYHYILDLHCDLEAKVMKGSITVFLDPAAEDSPNSRIFSVREYLERLKNKNTLRRSQDNELKDNHPASSIKLQDNTPPVIEIKDNAAPSLELKNNPPLSIKLKDNAPLSIELKENPPTSIELKDNPASSRVLKDNSEARIELKDNSSLERKHQENQEQCIFQLILDSHDLEVDRVEEKMIPSELLDKLYKSKEKDLAEVRDVYTLCQRCEGRPLEYNMEKWCIRVWKAGVDRAAHFPPVVTIYYSTKPEGTSLRWARDQDARQCMYTAAMWINNRAMLPCQEYGSLSSWQAYISTTEGATVLMSGDNDGFRTTIPNGRECWYHECRMPLPSFTLAIAVGYWQCVPLHHTSPDSSHSFDITCKHAPDCRTNYSTASALPARLFAPHSLQERATRALRHYWVPCSQAVQDILGAHPFYRVDIVIYPSCSQDMAMANPNLMFLSQSLLCEDGHMNIRVAHELSHSWFGLLIGAKDWTEEWLSEGFATYLEDSIHSKALNWSMLEQRNFGELRAVMRYQVLAAEMATTQQDLQTLRPNQGTEVCVGANDVMYVKNGLNANKLFTQVHYLKGYFLLRHLADLVGVASFNAMLKDFIILHHGELVLSQDFLAMVFDTFPELSDGGLSMEKIHREWLDCAGMPTALQRYEASPDNDLYLQVKTEVSYWKSVNTKKRKGRRPKCAPLSRAASKQMSGEQLVLILEELLRWDRMRTTTLTRLATTYSLQTHNPDVRHRWCELVVKHKYCDGYDDVRSFLINDQAMGVYLYGELMISGCKKQRTLAYECFNITGPHMEKGTYTMVHTMLHGE